MSSNKNKGGSRSNTPSNKKKNSNSNTAAEQSQAFQDALEDVHTRFILNLPAEELATSDRIFFQIEQAWWFYEDFICDDMEVDQSCPDTNPNSNTNRNLPRFKNLQPFAKALFAISPFLSPLLSDFDVLWKEFSNYRRQISTFGTILLNEEGTHVVLCQDYMGKSWTFPAGKVNQHESGMDAGVRETYEETGFDITCGLGKTLLMSKSGAELTWEMELKEENSLEYVEEGSSKRRTCFVCRGVPMDFPFDPVVRKEVRDVQWWEISSLPKKTFAVLPFIKGLRKWIRKNIKQNGNNSRASSQAKTRETTPSRKNSSRKRSKNTSSKTRSRHSTPGRILESSDLAQSGLGTPGEEDRWTEEEMFQVNEKLIGKKVDYDGNPHVFASDGFAGIDPHAFRVVGGEFMNSGMGKIAKAPQKHQLQPLCRKEKDDNDGVESDTINDDGLQPFFTNDGETPWGMVVSEALTEQVEVANNVNNKEKKKKKRSGSAARSIDSDQSSLGSVSAGTWPEEEFISSGGSNSAGLAVLATLRGKGENGSNKSSKGEEVRGSSSRTIPAVSGEEDIFMTDGEITAKSQSQKLKQKVPETKDSEDLVTKANIQKQAKEVGVNKDFLFCRQWVSNLDKAKPTKMFGEFRFDVNAIMAAVKTI